MAQKLNIEAENMRNAIEALIKVFFLLLIVLELKYCNTTLPLK